MRKLGLFVLLVGNVMWFAACGGNGGGGSSSVTSLSVSCSPSTVTSGGTSQCSATVFGTGNFSSAVNWSSSAGTISSSGVLTAPTVTTSTAVTVTATSVQNSSVSGTATVTVSPSTAAINVVPVVVDAGPQPATFITVNVAFVTVTVCVPGTTTCQNIDHVQVDTGSEGLRLLSSASGGELSLTLPQETDGNGNSLAECEVFEDGYVWGNVATADITMAGEKSPATPVQIIIPPSSSPMVPTSCSSQNPSGGAGNEGGSVMALGANGIIGVGLFPYDCGTACTPGFQTQDVYYGCPSSGCSAENIPLTQQVINPVFGFTATGDDNGVLLQLPTVPDGGSANPTGFLIFGISTQSNNNLSLATNVYEVNDVGYFTTTFNGNTYSSSFLDSGSNGFFFPDSSIPTCPSPNQVWFCPTTSPDNLSAGNQGTNMSSPVTVNFSIEDANTLFNNNGGNNTAFSTLGGPLPASMNSFDFGLPFFYGKNVFTAIQDQSTPGGPTGPFFAY